MGYARFNGYAVSGFYGLRPFQVSMPAAFKWASPVSGFLAMLFQWLTPFLGLTPFLCLRRFKFLATLFDG